MLALCMSICSLASYCSLVSLLLAGIVLLSDLGRGSVPDFCFFAFSTIRYVPATVACQSMQLRRKLEHSIFNHNLGVALRESSTVNPHLQSCICPRPAAAVRVEHCSRVRKTTRASPSFSTESDKHICTPLALPSPSRIGSKRAEGEVPRVH
jgi:hypothetical protein